MDDDDDDFSQVLARASAVHDEVMAVLNATFPHEKASVMLLALTFEVGRIAGQLADRLTDDELEAMLAQIMTTMREQVRWQAGQQS